jgi:N-hydroxyarylamine O-acetyltransferase
MRERHGNSLASRTEVVKINVSDYLVRIGVAGDLAANCPTLAILQRQHLLNVPFENLDIYWKRPIVLETESFFQKIVENKRGGFCYELNGLFDELLKGLGFETRLISGRVFNGKTHGPEFDHMAIMVNFGDEKYLVDVGFGDFASAPLRFVLDEMQSDSAGTFIIRRSDETSYDVAKIKDREWVSEYVFQTVPRVLSEFSVMCDYQQYSEDSHFSKGRVCSLLTGKGRKTLTGKAL